MSAEDVRRLLANSAASPTREVDVDAIFRNGRRLQRARAVASSLLAVALVGGAGLAVTNLDSIARTERRSTDPNPATGVPEGWTKLELPPQFRDGMSVVWAGSKVLAWGGCDPAAEGSCETTTDGFGFDPATRSWMRLEDAPLGGAYADVVWTGKEAVFLLGDEDQLEGQAYDPASGTWRMIASGPIGSREGAVSVWTGSEVIVWGGGKPQEQTVATGAAYDPTRDAWRRIAEAPVGLNLASATWTGREMLVFGSLLDNRNIADTKTSVGAAYDPVTDTWRELPASELSPQATSAVWVGDRMVAWDYEVHSQAYNADRNAWSAPVKMPLDFSECYPDSAVVGGGVFAFFCGRAALYETDSGTWEEIHGGLVNEEIESEAYGRALKLWRFAQLASNGDTVFLLAEGITLEESGEACYGCPGSPVSFWAYRPSL